MSDPDKIDVLVIPSWYPPDGGGIFKEHAELLSSDQFRVGVLVNRLIGLTSHKIRDIVTAWKRVEELNNSVQVYKTSILKLPYLEKLNTKRWVNKSLRHYKKFCKRHYSPDVIIAQSALWAGVVAEKIKNKYSVPYILVEHRGRFIRNNSYASSLFKNWHKNFFLPAFINADQIVCVSDALKEGLLSNTGISDERISVIPNMADHEFYLFDRIYQRVVSPFVFLSIGMLEKVKGYDILLKAFATMTEEYEEEFFLRIGGSGSEEKRLRALATDLGIHDRVSFLGKISRERVKDEMQKANVFISSSRFESFGIVLIEAAMTGLPLIATLSGGAQSIINKINGLLTEPDDSDALKDAMKKMFENYSSYDQSLIKKQAVEKYDRRTIIAEYQNLIKKIVNGK